MSSKNSNDSKKLAELYKNLDPKYLKGIKGLSLEEISKLRAKTNPYNTSIKEGDTAYLGFSYVAPHKDYQTKFFMTAMIGFLRRCLLEYKVPEDMPPVDVYEFAQNPNILDELTAGLEKNADLLARIDDYKKLMQEKFIIAAFLEEYFQYDPDRHVRSAYIPPVDGEDRKPIFTPAAIQAVSDEARKDPKFKNKLALVEHPRLQTLLNMAVKARATSKAKPYTTTRLNFAASPKTNIDKYLRYYDDTGEVNMNMTVYEMIPPADTFAQFTRYTETNYEALHDAVKNLYVEINDIDLAIMPAFWEPTEHDAKAKVERHKDAMTLPVSIATSGKWNILAPYGKNRDVVAYLSKDALLLQRMMEERDREAKEAKNMTEKKAARLKKENIKKEGPSDKKLAQYQEYRKSLEHGNIEEIGARSVDEELLLDELRDDEMEVPIIRIGRGGLDVKTSKIIIDAE